MMGDSMGFGGIWMILFAIIIVIPFWRICQKAGYAGWLSLLVLIPLANIIFIYFLGFAEWPVSRAQTTTKVG